MVMNTDLKSVVWCTNRTTLTRIMINNFCELLSFEDGMKNRPDRGITMKVNGDTDHDPSHPRAGQ